MPAPQSLVNFDVADATVEVWLFKKSTAADGTLRFTGRWIETDDALDQALRDAISIKRQAIADMAPYTLLAATSDGLALHIDSLETHGTLIAANSADPVPQRKVRKLKDVQNTDFYVVKLVKDDVVLRAVRKTDASWRSKKAINVLSVLYADDQLGLNENPGFNISREVDFFMIDDDVVILNKSSFESILSYKQAHADSFLALQAEPVFSGLFTSMTELVNFVGANKLHLRRACAIRQIGHYRNADFIQRLRMHHLQCGLNIAFDAQGRIVPSEETCADIIRALLDHRLSSLFSENHYDVPDATVVG